MELANVKSSEVTFDEELFRSVFSLIYRVTIRGITCVMKVIRKEFPDEMETFTYGLERDPFICETTAYQRMKENGLCDQGIVPQFYGTMEGLDPDSYRPYLDNFQGEYGFPSAILLEYVSGGEALCRSNYTRPRMDKFIEYLEEIHSINISHEDIHPRNMWIFPEYEDRVMWFDFNRAQDWTNRGSTEFAKKSTAEEDPYLSNLRDAMEADIAEGRLNRLALWYHTRPEPLPE